MDDVQLGRRFRALRHARGWPQAELASRADVSRGLVSLIERGRIEAVTITHLRRVARELEAEFVTLVRWRGGDLDRLMDEGHAALVGHVGSTLGRDWVVKFEVSYSVYGERGSIDILAWHPLMRTLLVIEVKTELTSIEETLRKHDEKARLARRVASDQFGWQASTTSRLLVLPELSTPRRRVQRQAAVLDLAYPVRGTEMRAWLRSPTHAVAGLLFVDPGARAAVSRKRIRCRKAA